MKLVNEASKHGERLAVADLRRDYQRAALNEGDVSPDPIVQFAQWFEEAIKAQVPEPNAMSVSTVTAEGKPASRILLLKDFDDRGFTWYTNYASRKGGELAAVPHAALLFFWVDLERQIRIEGPVEKVAPEEADLYFSQRPLMSRLGALASAQSQPIASREALEARFLAAEQAHGETPVRPENWGGYCLVPETIEFWQGRRSRLHDRIVYRRQEDGSWAHHRLQP